MNYLVRYVIEVRNIVQKRPWLRQESSPTKGGNSYILKQELRSLALVLHGESL